MLSLSSDTSDRLCFLSWLSSSAMFYLLFIVHPRPAKVTSSSEDWSCFKELYISILCTLVSGLTWGSASCPRAYCDEISMDASQNMKGCKYASIAPCLIKKIWQSPSAACISFVSLRQQNRATERDMLHLLEEVLHLEIERRRGLEDASGQQASTEAQ